MFSLFLLRTFIFFQLIIEKNEAKNEAMALQDELNVTRTKLAEIQIVQTEMQQSRSSAHSTIKSLEEEIRRLQSIINDLQQKESSDDRIYVLETQVRFILIVNSIGWEYHSRQQSNKN